MRECAYCGRELEYGEKCDHSNRRDTSYRPAKSMRERVKNTLIAELGYEEGIRYFEKLYQTKGA